MPPLPPHRLPWRVLLLLTVLQGGVAGAQQSQGRLRLALQVGGDTNASQTYGNLLPSAFLAGHLGAEGRLRWPAVDLRLAYELGARGFLHQAEESAVVQELRAGLELPWGRHLLIGLETRGRDRRGGSRPYTDLVAGPFAELWVDERVDLRLQAGVRRFLYWRAFDYTFTATELGLSLGYALDRQHSVRVSGQLAGQRYASAPRSPVGGPAPGADRRADLALGAGVHYRFRGPLQLGFGYAYADQASNSYGESLSRHRLELDGGVRLGPELFLLARLALQLSAYPDGIHLSPDVVLGEDEERHNTLVLRLSRPLGEAIDLDLQYSLYLNHLPGNALGYQRHLASVGLSLRP